MEKLIDKLEDLEVIYYDDEEGEFLVVGDCVVRFRREPIKAISESFGGEIDMLSVDNVYFHHHKATVTAADFELFKDGKVIEFK